MVTLKLPAGDIIRVEDGVWHADDPMVELILNDSARLEAHPSIPYLDGAMADIAVERFGAVILQADGPSQLFDPNVVY